MAKDNLVHAHAKPHFASNLEMLTGASGGYTEASPQFKTLQNVAKIYICDLHWKIHNYQATKQWLEELNVLGNLKIPKLEDDASASSDTQPKESEHKELVYEYHGAARKPVEEERPFVEEEGGSLLSDQSALPPEFRAIRRAATMDEDAVANHVTWLVKKPLEGPLGLILGYVYVISPPSLPGIFKIGFTVQHPKLKRHVKHNGCYGEVDLISKAYTEYAYRVEQLLLAEFSNKHYQLEVRCQKCKHSHRELLAVDKETLLKCLKKWVEFIALPANDMSGLLLAEAQSRIPPPRSKEFFRCGRPKRSPISAKKGDSQDPQTALAPSLDFGAATSIKKYSEVEEGEVDLDKLCSEVENIHLTPSKPANRRKSGQGYA